VEGACGIDFSQETLRIRPRMPAYWKWLGVRRLPFRGRLIAMYVARMGDHIRIHCDHEFTAPHPRDEWDRDVSDLVQAVEPHAHVIAFGRRDEHFIAVNNSSRQSINVALTMSELFRDPQRLHVRIYDSEQGEWSVEFDCEAAEMERFVVRVESEGFRLIETRPI
jgi:hypothetical protein